MQSAANLTNLTDTELLKFHGISSISGTIATGEMKWLSYYDKTYLTEDTVPVVMESVLEKLDFR